VSGSGGVISRSVTGEGFFPRQEPKRPLTAPQFRRNGGARQDSELHERKEGKNVCVDRNQPLTRPAAADENAVAVHPPRSLGSDGPIRIGPDIGLPQGGEGIGSEAGPCQESGHCDRGFGLREQRTNAAPCPRSSSWLSAVLSRPLFSSTFPVRSLVFFEPARRRGRACPTLVVTSGNAGGTASRPPTAGWSSTDRCGAPLVAATAYDVLL